MNQQPWTVAGPVEFLGRHAEEHGDIVYEGATVGGQSIGPFRLESSLAEPFGAAVRAGSAKNLRFFPVPGYAQLIGYENESRLVLDERSFWLGRVMLCLIFAFGLATVPFFGTGLIILFLWWRFFQKLRPAARLASHVRSLRKSSPTPA